MRTRGQEHERHTALHICTPALYLVQTLLKCHLLEQIQGESHAVEGAVATKYRGVYGTITTMVRTEGPKSLYNGLVAGLQRQMSFASVRIGLYDSMKQFYTRGSESELHNLRVTM